MHLSVGTRWRSAVGTTAVIVVRPVVGDVSLECAGAPMLEFAQLPKVAGEALGDGHGQVMLGRRYVDAHLGVELLCCQAGTGPLAIDGVVLQVKEPKPLPAS